MREQATAAVSLSNERLRAHFLGWQCRLRQHCMRNDGGRPSSGMRPRLLALDGCVVAEAITTVMVPADTAEHLAFFRFQVQRSNDPRQRYDKGLQYLQSTYFQLPMEFSDELTAVFAPESAVARRILAAGEVLLEFEQSQQTYRMTSKTRKLPVRDPARDLTLWHNRMFSPEISEASIVLGLQPQWHSAQAHPPPA